MGIQHHPHQQGQQRESDVFNELQTLGPISYVLWVDQLPSHIPVHDEQDFCEADCGGMHNCLFEQHPYIL